MADTETQEVTTNNDISLENTETDNINNTFAEADELFIKLFGDDTGGEEEQPELELKVVETEEPKESATTHEQELVKQQSVLKERETFINNKEQELQHALGLINTFKQLVASDPIKAAQVFGIQLNRDVLINAGLYQAPSQEETELGQIKKELQEFKQAQQQERAKQAEYAVRRETEQAIADKEAFFWLHKEKDPVAPVLDKIVSHYRETGQRLTAISAAQLVEKEISDRAEQYSQALNQRKPTKNAAGRKTLTNKSSGSSARTLESMSQEERMKLADSQFHQLFGEK